MKKTLLAFVLIGALVAPALAQSHSLQQIRQQADSLKNLYVSDGFQLLRETPLQMESEYDIPIVLPLTQGTFYQFVFIGEPTSRLYEVRMYDWQEKQVIFLQNRWGEVDGNVIAFFYIPKTSEYHMLRPVQVNKQQKRNLNGYVMLLKKSAASASNQAK
ncbi:MAG: hypothetical protein FJX92_04345 [Bacteroidetes bacterium]|nr:hypothetical protein [Bacteroidota bacterium]